MRYRILAPFAAALLALPLLLVGTRANADSYAKSPVKTSSIMGEHIRIADASNLNMHRTARITPLYAPYPYESNTPNEELYKAENMGKKMTLAAVVIDYGNEDLTISSGGLLKGRTHTLSVAKFFPNGKIPATFDLRKLMGKKGNTRGYIAYNKRVVSQLLQDSWNNIDVVARTHAVN